MLGKLVKKCKKYQVFVGIDIHERLCVAAILNILTGEAKYVEFFTTKASIMAFAKAHLQKNMVVGIEATSNSFFVASILKEYVAEVIMLTPEKHKDGMKTDKIDAYRIAVSLAQGTFNPCWIPPDDIQSLRELIGLWMALNDLIIRLKNRIYAVLMAYGIKVSSKDLSSKKAEEEIRQAIEKLPFCAAYKLSKNFKNLKSAEEDKEELSYYLANIAKDNPQVHLLITIPGISFVAALVIISEIGDISRFSSPKRLTKYAGLTPAIYQSGKRSYTGGITKAGRRRLRWILVQAANNAVRVEGRLRKFYLRLKEKKGHNKAIVACARKLLTIIWYMLTKGEVYRDCLERLYTKKKRITEKKAEKFVAPLLSDLASEVIEFLRREDAPPPTIENAEVIERLVKNT
jgi:transposase